MKIPCPHCAKPIVGTHGLKLHIKAVHEKRKDFMCNQCGRRFSQLISLQTHVKHVHFGIERAFSCKHCQRNFTSPRSRHLHVEKDHKTMQCPTCQRYFAFKKHLQDHSCLAPPTTTTTTTITKSAMTTKKDHAISSAMGLPPTTSQQQQCKGTVYWDKILSRKQLFGVSSFFIYKNSNAVFVHMVMSMLLHKHSELSLEGGLGTLVPGIIAQSCS